MRLSRFIILSILISTVLASCSNRPSYVLSDKKMIAVFQDLYLVDAIIKNRRDDYRSDSQKDALINGVLAKHGITQAELDSSLVWFADNIDVYTQIQDTVSARLQKRSDYLNSLNNNSYTYKISGFETELPDHYILDVNTPTFRFRIDSTRLVSFEKEKFRLAFDIQGVDSTLHRIESSIYYRYKDTIIVDKRKIQEDDYYVFIKPQLADSLLQEISGYVHMVMATDKMPRVLLNNIQNKDIHFTNDTIATLANDELVEEISPREELKKNNF